VLKAKDYAKVYSELSALRTVAPSPTIIKLILETSRLDKDEIVAATIIAGYAALDFVKTSTGFDGRGASLADVEVMRSTAAHVARVSGNPRMKVKASGGVRSLDDLIGMVQAGAERIGTSGGLGIVQEARGATTTQVKDNRSNY
jgi:deoxyribose-phosphate aldolase